MSTFSDLKKNLKKDFSNLRSVKVALLGDTATQFLHQALRGAGYSAGLNLQIQEADFNQIERQVLDPTSEFYEFAPKVVIIFQATHKLVGKYNKLKPEDQFNLAQKQLQLIDSLCTEIKGKLNTKIIYYNYPEIDDAIFGNYANKVEQSFLYQLRKLNFELMQYAVHNSNFYLCDLSSLQNQVGKAAMFQPSVYINTEMVLSIDALPLVAESTVSIIAAMYGQFKK
jgi:predicted enzyme involved in methoxymalonyl-ACP biosynthesis